MLINCDIGERGVAHEVDDMLMEYIDIANIACGGHAGDIESIGYYTRLAKKHGVKTTAHLSYPDKENFGRHIMQISETELLKDLEQQYNLIGGVESVKLHGALYNKVNIDEALADTLARWMKQQGVKEVLTPHLSALDLACKVHSITSIHEAFLDRRYIFQEGRLLLAPRSLPDALIEDVDEALLQYEGFKKGHIFIKDKPHSIKAQTLCIHSDSTHALDILKALNNV